MTPAPPPAPTVQPYCAPRWPYLLGVALFLLLVATHWDARRGFTSFLRFGSDYAATRLPAVAATPVASSAGSGYDGQFYAQLAVEPDPRAPALQKALDLPRYRARRILLPWLAHGLAAGEPWRALNIYAVLNLAAWLAVAWRLGRLVGHAGWRGFAAWTACVFSVGALDSVRFALTDLPATLVILIAVELSLHGRRLAAAALLGLGGLVRETTLLAAPLLLCALRPAHTGWRVCIFRWLVAAVPLAAWVVWLACNLPADAGNGVEGNLGWPSVAWVHQLLTCGKEIWAGNSDSRYTFGAVTALGLAYQSCFVLRRLKQDSPWIAVAVPFAALFWLLGDYVWHGYWAAARAVLPLTFAFNLLLLREPRFWWRFLLANASVLHGIYRFMP